MERWRLCFGGCGCWWGVTVADVVAVMVGAIVDVAVMMTTAEMDQNESYTADTF